jgi:hypothetical protein
MSKPSPTLTVKHGLHSIYKEYKPSLLKWEAAQIFRVFNKKTKDLQPVREGKGMGEGKSSKCYLGCIFHSKS